MELNDLSTPLTDAELEELDDFLLSVEHDDAVLDVSEFDGLITAIVSGPETIMPSVWMPALWGGEDNAPVWDSTEDFQRIYGLMIRHMNTTSSTLMQAPEEFEPLFLESTVEAVTHWVVDEWCAGFMRGVALYPVTAVTAPDMNEMLAPIRQFADPDGWHSLKGKDCKEIRRLQEQVAPAAKAIHAYWLVRRTPPASESATYIRPELKVGRHDPCPCGCGSGSGSGKKHKKCCGTH